MNKLKKCCGMMLFASMVIGMVACGINNNEDEVVYTAEKEAQDLSTLLDGMIEQGSDIDTTELGVYYVINEVGDGALVQPGDSIGISYSGYFVDGVLFDSSLYSGDGIWRYVYKENDVIPGFEDAVSQLHQGETGTFIIPSSLAYGAAGTYGIPPYSTLVFVIKLVDIYTEEPTL